VTYDWSRGETWFTSHIKVLLKGMEAGSKILVVDDDKDSLRFVRAVLESQRFVVLTCESGSKALGTIKNFQPDLILLDIHMPGLDGFSVIQRIKSQAKNAAVIFLTADKDTDVLIRGLEAGALDYINKPFVPQELFARIRAHLRVKKLQDQLMEANRKLQDLVDVDDLTGLYNMRTIYEKIDREIYRAQRYNHGIGIIMLDMDHFKSVNDNHDHLFGSQVLAIMGGLIRNNIRNVDFGARYGGDEFMICLSQTTAEGAEAFAERFRKIVEDKLFEHEEDKIHLTVSMGLAVVVEGRTTMDSRSLVRHADRALYTSKESGRNQVTSLRFEDSEGVDRKLLRHKNK